MSTPSTGVAAYGWDIDRPDPYGVVRARTKGGQWRIWVIPKSKVQEVCDRELGGGASHPGLYILKDDTSNRAYAGEAGDVRARLYQHLKSPPKELREFQWIYILNDGRNSVHSYFTDQTLRKALEQRVITLIKDRSATALANTVDSRPDLSLSQMSTFTYLSDELGAVLHGLGVIHDLPPPPVNESKVPREELAARFPDHRFENLKAYEGEVDGEPLFLAGGSEKPQGLQLTIRTSERWRQSIERGKGYVCYLRGPGYLIPMQILKDWLGDRLGNQTVDVFLDLGHEVLRAGHRFPEISVASYRGSKPGSTA